MMMSNSLYKGNPDRLNFDWIRIVIPYKFDVSDEVVISKQKNEMPLGYIDRDYRFYLLDVINLLGLHHIVADYEDITKHWVKQDYALWNYDAQLTSGEFRIMYGVAFSDELTLVNKLKMGMAIEISGKACRVLQRKLSLQQQDFVDFFKKIFNHFGDVKVTRLDIALDIFKKDYNVTPKRMYMRSKKKEIQSKLRVSRFIDSVSVKSGQTEGQTFYMGKSPMQLRVYDKRLERIYSHGDPSTIPKFWVRWELQLQNEVSQQIAYDYAYSGRPLDVLYFDCLNNMLTVLPSQAERAKYPKLKVSAWWSGFIDSRNRNRLIVSRAVPVNDFDKSLNWIDRQVSKTMYKTLLSHAVAGGDVKVLLRHWLEQGKIKMADDDMLIVNQFIDQHYDEITSRAYKSMSDATQFERDLLDDDIDLSRLEVDYYE